MDSRGRAGFEEFYRATYAPLVAQLYSLTGDHAGAQDVAQEAFGRAWTRWDAVSGFENPGAWVRLVGHRLAVSRWRKARTALRSLVRHGPPADAAGPGPDSVALVTALRRLPEAQRRALVLHHMGGRTVAEIATVENVAEGTVKARLFRGRQALAALLADDATPDHPAADGAATIPYECGKQ
ncbi:MAG: SigE family RNA polymerase sigma factor [Motilibacteraceae bacterium]